MDKAPIIGLSRLRIGTDGRGITTLVAFHGCQLRCKFCLNSHSISENFEPVLMSPENVMAVLQKDELYFWATGGGVTFGGGEPLLRPLFIKRLMQLGADRWHVTVETSLNVPQKNIELVLPFIDEYIVDIKDLDSRIYKRYTGQSNRRVMSNLYWLVGNGKAGNIICRVPSIRGYNVPEDRQMSKLLLENIGITRFDILTYNTTVK